MKIDSIKLKNIRSYKQEQIEFPQGTLLLSGDIGHGKSSLLMAIEFALFGLRGNQLSGGDLLREGSNKGWVELTFTINNQTITAYRELTRENQYIRQDNGYIKQNTKTELSPTELKAEIFKILGYPMEMVSKRKSLIYRYTVYTPQEEMKKIIEADEETRLDTLRKITGINRYKKIRENIDDVRNHLKKPYNQLEGTTKNLEQKQKQKQEIQEEIEKHKNLEQKQTERKKTLTQKLQKWKQQKQEIQEEIEKLHKLDKKKTEIKNNIKNTKERIKEHEQELQETENRYNKIKQLERPTETSQQTIEEKLNQLQKLKEKCHKKQPDIEKTLNKKIKQKQEIQEEIEKHKDQLKHHQAQKQTIEKNQEKLKQTKSKCPICGNQLNEKHRKKELNKKQQEIQEIQTKTQNQKQKLQQKQQQKQQLEQEINQKTNEIINRINQKTNELQQKNQQLHKYKEKKQQASQLKQTIEQKKQKIQKHKKQIQQNQKQLQKTKQKHQKQQKTKQKNQEVENKIEETRNKLNKTEQKITETKTNIKNKKRELKQLKKEIKDKKTAKQLMKKIQTNKQWLENLKNLSTTIERKYMTKIQMNFNEIFNKWFRMLIEDSDINVHVDQSFAPIIERGKTETEYKRLSGGERTSIALAYRLALNRVINQLVQDIQTKNMIILDEPTDGFSTNQLDKIRDIIDELNMQQIILVSHEPKMESYVDNIIQIQKTNNTSTATTL
ncbi:ATPase involved in DNA repair SbcC [Methanonatronarchaeum thermophilum]|uniref:ATPase involved in DNA repair SbcC n=1 Tax=Methanonatronarchaeum thermophilum TaxID=1927129 RepID=A0A1Y3GCL9_9EURY|nr:SMC family ATPase [Methanonatronarchaeum thermophilum]OUJ19188.1 ATPase involved in DNA repair SbcC [Methanonatronarchaeum thermophilum]